MLFPYNTIMDVVGVGSLAVAFGITIVLAVCHACAPILCQLKWPPSDKLTSFGSGVAVAYVFLHMLPGLVESNEPIGHMLAEMGALTPLLDIAIFGIALLGFLLFFTMEVVTVRRQAVSNDDQGVYWFHIGMFCLYNFLIAYTMPLRVQTGLWFAVLFTVAMGMHFLLTDRHFVAHFPNRFSRSGRVILAGALGVGWLVTAMTDPIHVVLVSLMIGFLAGSVLYNVFKVELPNVMETRYGAFVGGVGFTSVLLVVLTVLEFGHGA